MRIGVAEAKGRFAELVKLAASGEVVTLLKRGKPVAEIVAFEPRYTVRREDMPAAALNAALGQRAGPETGATPLGQPIVPHKPQNRAAAASLTLADIIRAAG
jgi:prevent-host-death family protein